VALRLGADRERIVQALDYLEEHGLVELRASEPRLRFERLAGGGDDPQALVAALAQRFQRREDQEVQRLQHVLGLAEQPGCQSAALVGYFGEALDAPCGHCTFCERGQAQTLPSMPVQVAIDDVVEATELASLCAAHAGALADTRQQARLLCGLSSPAFTQAKLSRQPLFGALEEYRFADVLAWCQQHASHL
jgi:ATP-dependent DNA helicase RecQ